ncbi:hypothetical protein Y386_10190 [Listeria monocytogenes]|nr:hypothetical protein [Listeria monocytogenes]EAC3829429.1 hypothetical protein [Listeria monocytogenes]EAC5051437.1 hypothetical protein [Listeria monocytogenes]EAC6493810.1 hypothetical protein [Listeria monocytogenes]EAC8267557.1 hypothetical protein [Listeria monocytogenes]
MINITTFSLDYFKYSIISNRKLFLAFCNSNHRATDNY